MTESEDKALPVPSLPLAAASNSIPLTTRLAIEIPKPKDWQAFQRNCVLLFRSELKDPNVQEYGRPGQRQRGIDILGRRDGRDDHFVGVQCRLIARPLKEATILSDARAALKLKAGLKELIFATTAPDDTGAYDAAIDVGRQLKAEGHDITIVVYGWGQLQILIAQHEVAYNVFQPSSVASSLAQTPGPATARADIADLVVSRLMERMGGAGIAMAPRELGAAASADEDPALHARIDTFRDLFKNQSQPVLARNGLMGLLEKEDLLSKPWAHYRIETNLGAIALDLGHEAEAASRFETAQKIRPNDPNALANLALARTVQGRFKEAMAAAQAALGGDPRADYAVVYLLQAAARSDWMGDPEALVPADLIGTAQADIGLAEFLRRRDAPGWAERSLEMARRHIDRPEFKRIRAIAVLSLAIDSAATIPGGRGPVTTAELNASADDMKAHVEHCLDVNFADLHDLVVHLNNAAVLLRLCNRNDEVEVLLLRGLRVVGDEPQLRRLLALSQSLQGRDADALATLANEADAESQIFAAELRASTGSATTALQEALAIEVTGLPERLQRLRWRLVGELSLRLDDEANFSAAVAALRALDPTDIAASLLEIRRERKTAEDEEVVHDRLRALVNSVPADFDMVSRYFLAEELRNQGLPEEGSRLLEGHVDLTRPSPATSLYLESLAAARRDETFRAALANAAPEVRNDPATLWTVGAHAWNLGDLNASMAAVEALLAQTPDDPRARLLRIEILIRQDRSVELLAALDTPLEKLAWQRPDDQFRLASLLWHFGFAERAADLAYRLFLQHRDLSRAWMTLSMLVLDEGRGDEKTPRLWNATEVAPSIAVDLTYDDGSSTFFVIELDAALRSLDSESWEPNHALVRAVLGLRVGERFVGPDEREGVVKQIRHKYVARLHYVLEHHETRFPEIMGFRRVEVDLKRAGGLDALIAQLKARHDWIQEQENLYLNGPLPIGVFAHRVGMDTIEVGAGLVSHGVRLKVAAGNIEERKAAFEAISSNGRRGCVLDLLAFWTAWRLEALDAVSATCGTIHLPPRVLDRLRVRREQFADAARDGLKSAGYDNGKIKLQEVPAEVMGAQRDNIDRAIKWAEANTAISPIVAGEGLPAPLREQLRIGRSDIFDSLALARQMQLLLVTDDLPTRELDRLLGGGGAWLHAVFGAALDWGHIGMDLYVRWSANLVDFGHGYLGVSGAMLAHATRLDADAAGEVPGPLFRSPCLMVGGRGADPVSHINAVIGFLNKIWSDGDTAGFRQPVTGFILRQLVRERTGDYAKILRTVLAKTRDLPALTSYIQDWLRGHFLARSVLGAG